MTPWRALAENLDLSQQKERVGIAADRGARAAGAGGGKGVAMSVYKSKRGESSIQFIEVARKIECHTLDPGHEGALKTFEVLRIFAENSRKETKLTVKGLQRRVSVVELRRGRPDAACMARERAITEFHGRRRYAVRT